MGNSDWLRTSDVCKYYRRGPQEVRAVDGVSLAVARGDIVGIVGASGSGKSTLLNLMAGLDTPTSGSIEFAGISLTTLGRRELSSYRAHRIGMVFQSFNLIPHYTALRNVELALYFNNTSADVRRDQAVAMLTRLGMADRLDHRPADLSGGEQQRVAIARALVKKPEILFADEPTGNLDQANSQQIGELLKELNVEGLTVVLVTHDQEMARRCARRIVRMHYGKVTADSDSEGIAQ